MGGACWSGCWNCRCGAGLWGGGAEPGLGWLCPGEKGPSCVSGILCLRGPKLCTEEGAVVGITLALVEAS